MKICKACGFNNPDSAHYCGGCGARLSGSHIWRLYDASTHTPVVNGDLNRLREEAARGRQAVNATQYREALNSLSDAQKEVKQLKDENEQLGRWLNNEKARHLHTQLQLSALRRQQSKKKSLWKRIDSYLDEHDNVAIGVILVVTALIIVGCMWLFKSCNGEEKSADNLQPIEVDGRWGIGYSTDRMLLGPEYDSIAKSGYTGQFILYDFASDKQGLAYAVDSTVNVIVPAYDKVEPFTNGRAKLITAADGAEKTVVARFGRIVDPTHYYNVMMLREGTAFGVSSKRWGNSKMLDGNGEPLPLPEMSALFEANCSTFLATPSGGAYHERYLLDGDGNRIGDPIFTESTYCNFFGGANWAATSQADRKAGRWKLVTDRGRTLLTLQPGSEVVELHNGVGFFTQPGSGIWHAVNAAGKELFTVEAKMVHPGYSGIYRVDRKDGRIGFVDSKGATVIPFDYDWIERAYWIEGEPVAARRASDGHYGKLTKKGEFTPD